MNIEERLGGGGESGQIKMKLCLVQACNCPLKKKRGKFSKASAERGSRNATGHDTHNGTLENVEVYYDLRCILSM